MWEVTAAANGVIMVAYSLIAATILRALVRTRQVRTNLLGTATAAIFFTCAVHHGSHTLHMLGPYVHVDVKEGLAMRTAFGWHAPVWDLLSAGLAVYYWTLRRSYDLDAGRRSVLETNDDIVQGLALAQYRYEAGDHEQAHAAVVATLASARRTMGDLVDPAGTRGMAVGPGDLVRNAPAQVPPPGT
jgi:hypothetical protein